MSGASHVDSVLAATAAPLLGYFLRRVQTPDDAADLVSDTLVTAWRSSHRMPGDAEAARMWVFGVARNILRHHDRGKRRRTAATIALGHALATQPRFVDDGDAIAVRLAVESLPDDLAELVRLIHWDGFSIEQSARMLGLRASTARSRHARAKTLLRAALDEPPGDAAPASDLTSEALR